LGIGVQLAGVTKELIFHLEVPKYLWNCSQSLILKFGSGNISFSEADSISGHWKRKPVTWFPNQQSHYCFGNHGLMITCQYQLGPGKLVYISSESPRVFTMNSVW